MKREYWKECPGCCLVRKAGELWFACLYRECPFHPFNTGIQQYRDTENHKVVETSFN